MNNESYKLAFILQEKQLLLKLPTHRLMNDSPTRWNSTLDMVGRFLEQEPAIYATLCDLKSSEVSVNM